MTEAKKPTAGNAYKEILAEPNSAVVKQMRARMVNRIRTLRLSIIFSKTRPSIPPAVISPQK